MRKVPRCMSSEWCLQNYKRNFDHGCRPINKIKASQMVSRSLEVFLIFNKTKSTAKEPRNDTNCVCNQLSCHRCRCNKVILAKAASHDPRLSFTLGLQGFAS